MSGSASPKNLQITVVQALRLPKHCYQAPKYFASVRIGSGQTQTTKAVEGANPEWNESFVFDAQQSSEVVVQIFRARKSSKTQPEITAEVTFSAVRCFQPQCQGIQRGHYNLLSPGPSSRLQGGIIIVSCTVCSNGSNQTAPYLSPFDSHSVPRLDLDSWKTASAMKDSIAQLVATTNRLIEIAEDQRLESLPGAKLSDVQWDPCRTCLPGTRKQLLDNIMEWVHNPDSERILWLSGPAGTGKSSVANSVAQRLHSLGRLGASFRFDRAVMTPDTPGHLFGNLCYQLAHFDDQLRTAMLSAIHKGCGGAMSLAMQARTLLVKPTRDVAIIGPVVIVIDAIDESGTEDEITRASREALVQAIVDELPSLPPSIKVLITSREEGSIPWLMQGCSSCLQMRISDDNDTRSDILMYIQHRMRQINMQRNISSLDDWPGASKECLLAQYADGLFICADVACEFIQRSHDPDIELEDLLNGVGLKGYCRDEAGSFVH